MTGARPPAGAPERAAVTAEVFVVQDCPNHAGAERALRAALERVGLRSVPVNTTVVTSAEQAAEVGFAGSPSFHLDGQDLFPADPTGDGASPAMATLACRLYATAAGPAGLPEQDALVAAVAARGIGGSAGRRSDRSLCSQVDSPGVDREAQSSRRTRSAAGRSHSARFVAARPSRRPSSAWSGAKRTRRMECRPTSRRGLGGFSIAAAFLLVHNDLLIQQRLITDVGG